MTARTSRTLRRATIAAVTAAVALALAPAGAEAGPLPAPVFTYLDVSAAPARQLSVANSDGSQITAPSTVPFALTPAGYQTYTYDVSADGSTLLVALRRGTPTAHVLDSTYAIALVHREGVAVTTRVIANQWAANPVLSPDGRTVWWLSIGRTGVEVPVWRYDVSDWTLPGARQWLGDINFRLANPDQEVLRFAVSPDGRRGATLVGSRTSTGAVTSTWVRASTMGVIGSGGFAKKYGTAAVQGDYATFVWTTNNQLLFDEAGPSGFANVLADVPENSTFTTTTTAVPALHGFYDIRSLAGTWYMWKEIGPAGATASSVGSTTDVLAPPADGTLVPRSNGSTTFWYVPTAAAPPALTTAAELMTSHPGLSVGAAVAAYGSKVGYYAASVYGIDPNTGAQLSTAAAGGDTVFRGILQTSIDGVTYRNTASTTGSRLVRVGTRVFSGYTPALARNTWVRWYYPGDMVTTAAYSKVSLVKVVPRITVSLARSGASTTVRGAATRHRGTALLQRNVGGRWSTVATTSLTYAGAYSFGARALARGTYRVLVLADRYWAAGAKAFTV
ncbi:MAG: hypothetical protein U0R68_08470 [Candidatus Nanopelagicales bacterium]